MLLNSWKAFWQEKLRHSTTRRLYRHPLKQRWVLNDFAACRFQELEDRTLLAGSLEIGDIAILEGNAGVSAFEFTVTRNGLTNGEITVDYETGGGNATPVQTILTERIVSTSADGAEAVFAADVDGNGHIDILSASYFTDTIHWYANDGSGNFVAHEITTTANGAEDVSAADLDGDGDMDVIAASREDTTVAWYENDGNENFTFHAISTSVRGATKILVSDLNADGHIDVLATSDIDNTIYWYENDGNGVFSSHIVTDIANGVASIHVEDVDEDGAQDVLSANSADNTFAWFQNDGSENFTRHIIYTGPLLTDPQSISAADMDDDGDIDVLSTSGGDDIVAWYENDGSENFVRAQISATPDGAWSLHTADVDGDGDTDVITASGGQEHTLEWHENLGRGYFTTRVFSTGRIGPLSVFAKDLDGDGDLDLLSSSVVDDTIAWHENDLRGDYVSQSGSLAFADGETEQTITVMVYGDDLFEQDEYFLVSLSNTSGASVDDGQAQGTILNDDPLPDASLSIGDAILTEGLLGTKTFEFTVTREGDTSGETVVNFETVDGTALGIPDSDEEFTRFSPFTIDDSLDGARDVYTTDINGDGHVDILAVSDRDNKLAWFENDGNENFTYHLIATIGSPTSVYAADVDRDGNMDVLAVGESNEKVLWYKNDGNENFTQRTIANSLTLDRPNDIKAVDLDEDGDIDLVVSIDAGAGVVWFKNNGNEIYTFHEIGSDMIRAEEVQVIDLDQDGDLDLLSSSKNPAVLVWFDNDGQENFTKRTIASGISGINSVYAADMDGDGDLDVLSSSTYYVQWHENDGAENFTTYLVGDLINSGASVSAADIDGDGDMDVITGPHNLYPVVWYENLGNGNYRYNVVSTEALNVQSIFVADVDSDGDLDILSASYNDDSIRWYENTGGVLGERGDYQSESGSLLFAAGEIEKTISVQVVGDADDEPNQNFFVQLSGAIGATIIDGEGEGRILNDDVREVWINDVTLPEGDQGTRNFEFIVTRPGSDAERLRVEFIIEDVTATSGADYGPWQGNIIFEPGQSQATIAIPVYADLFFEEDETFQITLIAAGDTLITDGVGIGTILNDDDEGSLQPTISISDVAVIEGNGLGGGEFLDAFVSAGSGGLSTPSLMTFGPDGHLYVGTGIGVFRFHGETGAPLPAEGNQGALFITDGNNGLHVAKSIVFGPDENMYVLGDGVLRFNPVDGSFVDEFIPASQFSYAVSMTIGPDGMLYVLNQNGSSPHQVKRFNALTGEFIDIFVGDNAATPNTDETGGLSSAQDAIFGPDGDLYIVNDSRDPATAGVLRYNGSTGAFLERFAIVPDPHIPRSLSFSADGASLLVTDRFSNAVMRFNATTGEYEDDFVPSGSGGLEDPFAIVVGPDGNVYIGSVETDEILRYAGSDGTQATFTVTRAGDTSTELTVDWETADGTAIAGEDYIADNGTLTFAGSGNTLSFAAGVTQQTISINVIGETEFEADESFFVNLTGVTGGAVIVDNQGTATIINEDVLPPTFSINDFTAVEGHSGVTQFQFNVTRQGDLSGVVTVDYQTVTTAALVPGGITTSADGAISVFAADVDGDGDTDAVSAAWTSNTIEWYENDGEQNFTAHTVTTSAGAATSVWAEDVDGDGDMDLLSSAWNDDTIAWYENDGNENFTTHTINSTADSATSVRTADIDGDGDIDVLSTSFSDNTIAWYENDGEENFTIHTISTTSAGAWIASGTDVDGDGDVDVITASFGNDTIAWYENDGSENFTYRTVSTSANSATWVDAVDLDDDGDIDLLSTSRDDDKVAWYENDGNENFTPHTISTSADGVYSLTVLDVDGDGDSDVVSASANDNKLAWYENDGAGNFIATHTISTTANGARAVYAADVDSDGDADLLYASINDDTIGWYESNRATADVDFAATSGTLIFDEGVSEQTISVSVFGDAIVETDEMFFVLLSSAVGATINDEEGIGTIQNDDPSSGEPLIAISDNSGSTDDASVQFTTPLSQYRSGVADSLWVRPGFADSLHHIDITNSGTEALTLFEITINAPDVTVDVVLTADAGDDIQLAPGETYRVNLTYAPTQPTSTNLTNQDFVSESGLVIHSNAANATIFTVSLQGKSTYASDVNYDGSVNFGDMGIFNNNFGLTSTSPNWDPTADINGDGAVNFGDVGQFNVQFGSSLDSVNVLTTDNTDAKSNTTTNSSTSEKSTDSFVVAVIENEDMLLKEIDNSLATEAAKLIAPDKEITPALYEEPPTSNDFEAVFEQLGCGRLEESLVDLFEFNSPLTDDLALV